MSAVTDEQKSLQEYAGILRKEKGYNRMNVYLENDEAIKTALKVLYAAEEAGLENVHGYDVLMIAVETILERTAAGAEVKND